MSKRIIEICCGSYYDAKQSYLGGAKRIELNCALHLGGLTPSIGTLELIKDEFDLKVISMLRPRGAGFNYNDDDFKVMLKDCELLLQYGSDGIAFGCLSDDNNVDILRTSQIVEIINKYNKESVFHRAFDCVNNPYKSIELLINIGVTRILTSGQKPKAIDGIDLIKDLQKNYGDSIEILAGSGINSSNARNIMDVTNIHQVHSSCKNWIVDKTTSAKDISYSYAENEYKSCYDVVSKKLVRNLIESVESYA